MVSDTGKTLSLQGKSGKIYIFNLYSFQTFHDLDDAFNPLSALYVLTRREFNGSNYSHDLIYLGETSNLSTRFSQHHKAQCISINRANCIGLFTFTGTDAQRKVAEKDILCSYYFPCNEQNN